MWAWGHEKDGDLPQSCPGRTSTMGTITSRGDNETKKKKIHLHEADYTIKSFGILNHIQYAQPTGSTGIYKG